jgi:hypothetical protein
MTMFRRSVLAIVAISVFSLPALAAEEFWVVKNEATKNCEVVDKKPDGKTLMEVGKKSYKDKKAAEEAMKEDKECK